MSQKRREELAERFGGNALLMVLLFNPWFRLVLGLLLLAVLTAALSLPKLWTVSPPGFLPVCKISVLDVLQSRALARTARRATAAGRWTEALAAWRLAFANNPGEAELSRGLLRAVQAMDRVEPAQIGPVLFQAQWLLRLTQTNRADVELAATVYSRLRLHDVLYQLVRPQVAEVSVPVRLAYLQSLVFLGQPEDFEAQWRGLPESARGTSEARVTRDASLALWGPPAEGVLARERLAEAARGERGAGLANRLNLVVAAQRGEVAAYRESLARLEEAHADTAVEQANLWRLMAAAGQPAEAVAAARAYARPPASAFETLQLASALLGIGEEQAARDLLRRYTGVFSYADELWLLLADLAIQARAWDELRRLAILLRSHDQTRGRLGAFSHFLEGAADQGTGRREMARVAFAQAAHGPFPNPAVALAVAVKFLRGSHADLARQVLVQVERDFPEDPNFWQMLTEAAFAVKDDDTLLRSASRAYALRPDNPIFANNYAAALLILRQRPEEAVRLTRDVMEQNPGNLVARVNHALALILNRRTREAAELLQRIPAREIGPVEAPSYFLGWFEIHLREGHDADAARVAAEVDPTRLFPRQRAWFERARADLKARLGEEPGTAAMGVR